MCTVYCRFVYGSDECGAIEEGRMSQKRTEKDRSGQKGTEEDRMGQERAKGKRMRQKRTQGSREIPTLAESMNKRSGLWN